MSPSVYVLALNQLATEMSPNIGSSALQVAPYFLPMLAPLGEAGVTQPADFTPHDNTLE